MTQGLLQPKPFRLCFFKKYKYIFDYQTVLKIQLPPYPARVAKSEHLNTCCSETTKEENSGLDKKPTSSLLEIFMV